MKLSATKACLERGSALIIGYGNPLRGDDAVGFVVADRLITAPLPPQLMVIRAHQLTPEMAEPLSRVSLAIFVDAACDWGPGRVRCVAVEPEHVRLKSLCHHLTPQRLLDYAKVLYGRAPEAWVITVGGEVWGYCDGLSPGVARAVPRVLHQIDLLMAARLPIAKVGVRAQGA
jgi:hydrogenase maturation protease